MSDARFHEIEGQKLRVLDTGVGRPTVVLHGWGGRIESMAPVIACLEGSTRVVALDLPGFGESPAPVAGWGTPEYAGLIQRLLASLGIDRAHLVGHSFGAKISLYLAATRPELVDKVVLVGSSGLRRAPSVGARVKRALSRSGRAAGRLGPPGRALQRAIFERVASQDYRQAGALRPVLVTVVNEDLRDLLPKVQAPTLLVWGGKDDAVPIAHARIMEREIPDAGLVVFEEAGHFAYLDEPDRFCTVLRQFLVAPEGG